MSFDNTCKFLAENFPEDIATWLTGKEISVSQLKPSELSIEPLRADSLIFLEAESVILHLEFQVKPRPNIPFRMADYYLRLYRRSPNKSIRQVVVYLRQSNSPLLDETQFQTEKLTHEFEVIRIWECPWQDFLVKPGLYPFAVLAQNNNPETVLQTVSEEIEKITESKSQREIATSTYILAGLVLEEEVIKRLLREEVMRESVTYQAIQKEGLQQGIQQGLQQGERAMIFKFLKQKIGEIPNEVRSRLEALSVTQLESLAESVLDFSTVEDLKQWLEMNQIN